MCKFHLTRNIGFELVERASLLVTIRSCCNLVIVEGGFTPVRLKLDYSWLYLPYGVGLDFGMHSGVRLGSLASFFLFAMDWGKLG